VGVNEVFMGKNKGKQGERSEKLEGNYEGKRFQTPGVG